MRLQPRSIAFVFLALVLVGVTLPALTACGASARHATIRDTLVTVDAARDGWFAADHAHEEAILAGATSHADGEAKLAAWRATSDKIAKLVIVTYRTIAVAAVADDDPTLAQAVAAGAALVGAVKGVK